MYSLHHSSSLLIDYFESGEHSQIPTLSTQLGLSVETKTHVEEIFLSGQTRPDLILRELGRKNIPIPQKSKLIVFLRTLRKKHFGENIVRLNQLESWCIDFSKDPQTASDCYVLDYYTDFQQKKFKIVLTSKILIELCKQSELLQIDSTYKLNWNGFPVMIAGSSDKNRVIYKLFL